MSSKAAKVFVAEKNVRNTTAKEKHKDVYKHVLDSPFVLKWPKVQPQVGEANLTALLKTLEPMGKYRTSCRAAKKEKKDKSLIDKPDLYPRLHVGINEVTQFLEKFIQNKQSKVEQKHPNATPVVYICKREFKPQTLCQHFLYMAALANVQLIVLPAESEAKIGRALGISRASVVLVEIVEDKEEKLRLLAKDIPFVDAPWLQNALTRPPHFITENIKTLKTVAPIVNKPSQKQQNEMKRKADTPPQTDQHSKKMKKK